MSCSRNTRCTFFHCKNLCSSSSASPVVGILFFSVQNSREESTIVRLRRANIWRQTNTAADPQSPAAPRALPTGPYPWPPHISRGRPKATYAVHVAEKLHDPGRHSVLVCSHMVVLKGHKDKGASGQRARQSPRERRLRPLPQQTLVRAGVPIAQGLSSLVQTALGVLV